MTMVWGVGKKCEDGGDRIYPAGDKGKSFRTKQKVCER